MTRVALGLATGTWYVETTETGRHDAYSTRDEDYDAKPGVVPVWLAEVLTRDAWPAPFSRDPDEQHL